MILVPFASYQKSTPQAVTCMQNEILVLQCELYVLQMYNIGKSAEVKRVQFSCSCQGSLLLQMHRAAVNETTGPRRALGLCVACGSN